MVKKTRQTTVLFVFWVKGLFVFAFIAIGFSYIFCTWWIDGATYQMDKRLFWWCKRVRCAKFNHINFMNVCTPLCIAKTLLWRGKEWNKKKINQQRMERKSKRHIFLHTSSTASLSCGIICRNIYGFRLFVQKIFYFIRFEHGRERYMQAAIANMCIISA